MSKPIVKPGNHSTEAMFALYVKRQLADNAHYFYRLTAKQLCSYKDRELQATLYQIEQTRLSLDSVFARLFEVEGSVKDYLLEVKLNLDRSLKELRVKERKIRASRGEYVVIMDYKLFREVICRYNKLAVEHLIKGRQLNLLSSLGYLQIRVVERNMFSPTVDRGATMKRKAALLKEGKELYHPVRCPQGEQYLVFYTDDDWCRIGWCKFSTRCRNISVYSFRPASGQHKRDGFKQKMSRAIKANPMLKYNYPYYPAK